MFSKLRNSLTRIAELITAILLAVIFITFLLQIFTRYAPKIAWLAPFSIVESWMASLVPIGWTVNLISLLWVWLIFIGCSFALQDRNHVTFDVFYNAVPLRWRRIFAVITVSLLMSVFAYALGPTFDAIFVSRLMELKKIQRPTSEFRSCIPLCSFTCKLQLLQVANRWSRALWARRIYHNLK